MREKLLKLSFQRQKKAMLKVDDNGGGASYSAVSIFQLALTHSLIRSLSRWN